MAQGAQGTIHEETAEVVKKVCNTAAKCKQEKEWLGRVRDEPLFVQLTDELTHEDVTDEDDLTDEDRRSYTMENLKNFNNIQEKDQHGNVDGYIELDYRESFFTQLKEAILLMREKQLSHEDLEGNIMWNGSHIKIIDPNGDPNDPELDIDILSLRNLLIRYDYLDDFVSGLEEEERQAFDLLLN